MFSVWDADASGANIKMAVLVVASLWGGGVEVEFDIHCIGREKVVVVVSVRLDAEVLKSLTPLLGTLGRGRVAKEKCDVDEAHSKEGLGTFNVLAVMDESGKGLVQTEKLVELVLVRLVLAGQG